MKIKNIFSIKFLTCLFLVGFIAATVWAGNKSAMFTRHQPGGMYAVINQELTTGSIFFVDDSGSDSASCGQSPVTPR